ncbi:hypothetical protein [Streptomyces sp. NPDC005438]|uniref:hypothetical protein n=1 Tax=Streptomyces sp. NPDC005438 TaxID=3156880 RepID=UPI0033A5DA04
MRGSLPLTALVVGALALSGCGGEESKGEPEGWKTLRTPRVTVSYPGEWKAQSAAERGEHTQGAAVVVKDGRTVAKVAVQLRFIKNGDAEMAAAAAMGSVELGGRIKGQRKVEVPGTDDARRVDYTQTGDGKPGKPAKGAKITGIDVVGVDSEDAPFLVRVSATEEGASKRTLEKIADSVRVTSGD